MWITSVWIHLIDACNVPSELSMSLQDQVALLAANGRFMSAPDDGGRVYCLSEKAGDHQMIQVGYFQVFLIFWK